MNKKQVLVIVSFVCFVVVAFTEKNLFVPNYPKSWPQPNYDYTQHPLNKDIVALGRKLFYDPILSKNNTVSCANCHLSYTAFTHVDHKLSHGIYDSVGTRNSLALVNLAWQKLFMWDGAVNHLEVQALAPISHPAEMGSNINEVLNKLNSSEVYQPIFNDLYQANDITSKQLLVALAQFQLTFISSNSKYDKVQRGEAEFTAQEEKGYKLFAQHCNSCHTEPLFTNHSFASNGILLDSKLKDVGRYKITQNGSDSLKFKVPSLRNIEFSQPYMHDGRFGSLSAVLNHYANSIDSTNHYSDIKYKLNLSHEEQIDIIAFLLTLTDKEFLFNPDLAFPRNN